jgi:hypothetical protein
VFSQAPRQKAGDFESVARDFGCSHGLKITWIGDVSLAARANLLAKRDTRYYVATLIPATASSAAHPTSASESGMSSQAITNATILAGDIVRYDFALNISKPIGVWTRGGGCPKNLFTFVVAIVEDSGRTDPVGFVL